MPQRLVVAYTPRGKVREDAASWVGYKFLVVGDGVTRTPALDGTYPLPSPAAQAASRFVRCACAYQHLIELTDTGVGELYRLGNQRIWRLNEHLGLNQACDWYTHDLAGTVGSAVWCLPDYFRWSYMADCGVKLLDRDGHIVFRTPNDYEQARQYFPATADEPLKVVLRREYRNHPKRGMHQTYGVLTGEPAALEYVKTGVEPYQPGQTLLVHTDGLLPYLANEDFCRLLVGGDQSQILWFIRHHPLWEDKEDDVTAVILRL